jgi:hypothetical protein
MIYSKVISANTERELQVKLNSFTQSLNLAAIKEHFPEIIRTSQSETATTFPGSTEISWNVTLVIFYKSKEKVD